MLIVAVLLSFSFSSNSSFYSNSSFSFSLLADSWCWCWCAIILLLPFACGFFQSHSDCRFQFNKQKPPLAMVTTIKSEPMANCVRERERFAILADGSVPMDRIESVAFCVCVHERWKAFAILAWTRSGVKLCSLWGATSKESKSFAEPERTRKANGDQQNNGFGFSPVDLDVDVDVDRGWNLNLGPFELNGKHMSGYAEIHTLERQNWICWCRPATTCKHRQRNSSLHRIQEEDSIFEIRCKIGGKNELPIANSLHSSNLLHLNFSTEVNCSEIRLRC